VYAYALRHAILALKIPVLRSAVACCFGVLTTTFFLYPLFEQGFLNFLVLCLLGWARFVLHGVLL